MIPIIRPVVGEDEIEAVTTVLRSGWLTQGARVAEFEEAFATCVGAEFACAVSSCTTASHCALLVVGVRPGDEVVTVSHSYIATANAIRYCGAKPVFVDIERNSFNIDPLQVEQAVTERTRAILCVHQMGMPCDLSALKSIARRHNLALVEDAACAIGSELAVEGEFERIGKPHGDIACFSFHPRKIVTTGDGGMITTQNPEWDARLRLLRQHGMNVSDRARHGAKNIIYEAYSELGLNYRMTDLQAAIGIVQIERLPRTVARRRELVERYSQKLATVPGLNLPQEPDWARSNWQSFCVRLPDRSDQRTIMQAMLDRGVSTRRGIMCAHREPAYPARTWTCGIDKNTCRCSKWSCDRLVESEQAQDQTIILPLYHEMTATDQDQVIESLLAALETSSRSAARSRP